MNRIQELIQELEQEGDIVRRTLERIPDDRMGWRPHEKSMTLGQLAGHLASIPASVIEISAWPSFDVVTSRAELQATRPVADSVAGALEMLDRSVAVAKAAFGAMDDEALAAPWRMVHGDREVGTIPRGALFRTALFSHWAHHRGQLTVYLRLAGAAVPPIYGDSADERAFVG